MATNTCYFLNKDVAIHNVAFTLEADIQTIGGKEEASVQTIVKIENANTEMSKIVRGIGI